MKYIIYVYNLKEGKQEAREFATKEEAEQFKTGCNSKEFKNPVLYSKQLFEKLRA